MTTKADQMECPFCGALAVFFADDGCWDIEHDNECWLSRMGQRKMNIAPSEVEAWSRRAAAIPAQPAALVDKAMCVVCRKRPALRTGELRSSWDTCELCTGIAIQKFINESHAVATPPAPTDDRAAARPQGEAEKGSL